MTKETSEPQIEMIPLNKIKISRNSRAVITYEELSPLMSSIKQTGLLQPIGLVKNGTGYEIAFGNRRFLACSKLGWASIPAIVRETKNDFDIDIRNLTENLQRRNLGLVEIGRYIELLKKEGLSPKECAVRLSVTPTYIESCITAYERVPEKYREDIEVRTTVKKGERTAPGKITIAQANAITSNAKRYGSNKKQEEALFKAAKLHGPAFKPERIHEYTTNLNLGRDAMAGSVDVKFVHINCQVPKKEYERVHKKYVENGAFKTVAQVLRAIVTGEVHESVKIIPRK